MAELKRTSLFGKLNRVGYRCAESATVACKLRGNPYVELSHWIQQVFELPDSDLHRVARHFEIDPSRVAANLTAALEALPRGATAISDFSPHLEEAVKEGWMYASLMFGASSVRTGHVVVGILKTPSLRSVLFSASHEFEKIKVEVLTDSFASVVGGSPEDDLGATDGSAMQGAAAPGEYSGAIPPAAMGKQEALRRFSVDLTEKARAGEIDPIVGRDEEIRQIIDILMRRRQNNPILTGEAGVGKTAVVEGFALRIAAGEVPPPLKDIALRTLDLGLLQAGASMKGEFEERLRQVIEEVQASPTPIVLFIDEAHMLVGAGGAAGQGDAANLLKPELARGTLRTIAATTWAEYKKYFEKDPALTRRFQVIKIDEPSEDLAVRMMRRLASTLEHHHRVQLLDEAIASAVRLSHRYIPDRQLPDKAVSLLDTASARVAVSQHAVPARVEDLRRDIEAIEVERAVIDRETALGMDHSTRAEQLVERLDTTRVELEAMEDRWAQECVLVDRILEVRRRLRHDPSAPIEDGADTGAESDAAEVAPASGSVAPDPGESEAPGNGTEATVSPAAEGAPDEAERAALLEELRELQSQLEEMQGEHPLILPSVDMQAVASVVGDWTGIPVGRMVRDEIETVLHLADALEKRVIGQRHALEMITRRIQTSRAALENPKRPIGVFLLCGPSGVGKTETALALAEALYGGEHNLITINMSEFQEAHTVSTLKGAPPGYVGYGEGGVLTEAVRRRPYSVVLLDEVEKAHADVHEIFFQVFDKGEMEDGEGRLIDFRNTIILLTSNVGTDLVMSMCGDPELMPDPEGLGRALREPLLKTFPAALLGRLVTIPYFPLSDDVLNLIIRLQLGRIQSRIAEEHTIPFTYDDEIVQVIASRCTEVESGARMVEAILTNTVLPEVSRTILTRILDRNPIELVHVGMGEDGFVYRFD